MGFSQKTLAPGLERHQRVRMVKLVGRRDGDNVQVLLLHHLGRIRVTPGDVVEVADLNQPVFLLIADCHHLGLRVRVEPRHMIAPHTQPDHTHSHHIAHTQLLLPRRLPRPRRIRNQKFVSTTRPPQSKSPTPQNHPFPNNQHAVHTASNLSYRVTIVNLYDMFTV